jgi:kynurenine 3-monooxygenase
MNAGFEDCEVLASLLDAHQGDLGAAIAAFTDRRRPDAHAICDLALYNYTEMSTLVLSKAFLARKWLYNWLHYLAPKTFVPLYTMVSFSQIPYSKAVEKRDSQDALVSGVGHSLLVGGLGLLAYKLLKGRFHN